MSDKKRTAVAIYFDNDNEHDVNLLNKLEDASQKMYGITKSSLIKNIISHFFEGNNNLMDKTSDITNNKNSIQSPENSTLNLMNDIISKM